MGGTSNRMLASARFRTGIVLLLAAGLVKVERAPPSLFRILVIFSLAQDICSCSSRHSLDEFHFKTDGVGQPLLNAGRTAMGPSFEDVVSRDFQFDIEDHDVIVFLHIQKTGGTTFGKHLVGDLDLARQCECRRRVKKRCTCLRPGRNSFETWLFSRHSTGWKCGLHADWTELTSCVDDVMDKLEDNEIKRRYFYITMLRHPVYRFLSEFHHVGRGATWRNARLLCQGRHATKEEMPSCYQTETWENVTLDEFMGCKSNLAINRQTRMLADLSLVGCYNTSMMTSEERGRIMLLSAKNNLKKMAFFGLTEEQEISQYLFEVTFNLKFRVRFKQYNQTITDIAIKDIDTESARRVEELNFLDMELYKYAPIASSHGSAIPKDKKEVQGAKSVKDKNGENKVVEMKGPKAGVEMEVMAVAALLAGPKIAVNRGGGEGGGSPVVAVVVAVPYQRRCVRQPHTHGSPNMTPTTHYTLVFLPPGEISVCPEIPKYWDKSPNLATLVPSHCNLRGNEVADAAAKMALSEVNITPVPLPLSTAKLLIFKKCRSAWDRSLGDALRTTSMGQYRVDSSPHPWIRQTSRVLDVALTRLRIGHTTLTAHLHRLQLTPDPYCPWCRNVPESIEHFLLQCPRFHSHRQLLRGQLIALNVTTFDLPTLLAAAAVHPSQRPTVIRLTCAFLRKTNQLSRL
ncbi:Heparan-sulfate 6-O-sulfotransferase 2 [Chionoecetes opilio]|uniref:Heparan-sulfate 6-O-sulfotransferase n=1 Tax=Chionoecetes opilio TaxID=41210 RepID=A0A8J4YP88_CHIOP|nr:Heparan-sulfate 6-O-sulfotransferase 2 [Chionoecetes opilio]